MTALEKEIEVKLRRMVQQHGGMCLKWVCPGWSGVPDRIILLPGGLAIFVELKRPTGGRLSTLQKWWGNKLNRLDFPYWVIWNEEHLQEFKAKCLTKREETKSNE